MSKTAGSHMLHTFTDVHDAYSLVCDFNASTDPVHREDCYAMVSSSAMTDDIGFQDRYCRKPTMGLDSASL